MNLFSVPQGSPDQLKSILKKNPQLIDMTLIANTVLRELEDNCKIQLSSHSAVLFPSSSLSSYSYEHLSISRQEEYGNCTLSHSSFILFLR